LQSVLGKRNHEFESNEFESNEFESNLLRHSVSLFLSLGVVMLEKLDLPPKRHEYRRAVERGVEVKMSNFSPMHQVAEEVPQTVLMLAARLLAEGEEALSAQLARSRFVAARGGTTLS
jgi:hypothetical protein